MNNLFRAAAFTVAALFLCSHAGAQTTIAISNTAIQTNTKPIGINLGTMTPYGSNQLYANLIATNPGFNDAHYQSVVYCTTGTNASLCANGSNYGWSTGFWPLTGGTAVRVLTGVSAGCTTTLNSGGVNSFGFATTTACSATAGISVGDYIELTKTIGSSTSGYNPAYGWVQSGSGSTYSFTHSTDAPPSTSTSTYSSSVEMAVTNGSDAAYLENLIDNQYLPWTGSTVSFINLSGNYSLTYWAKSVSGASPAAVVSFGRSANVPCVSACFVNFTSDTLTGTWTKYTHNFTASETGSQGSTLQLTIATTGLEDIRVANVAVTEQPTGGNTTVFRNAVVSTLQTLKPGSLRMWDQVGLTNTLSNMLVDQYARYPTSFSSYPQNAQGYYNSITYGLTDFLQLCSVVGAEPWISMPVNITPADASYLIDYLGGGSGTAGGAYRIAQGYTTPWTTVFAGKHIHLELGNEEWNGGTFEGGSMEYGPGSGTYQGYAVYGHYAQSIFASMKATASYSSSVMLLTLSGFFEGPGSYTQQGQNGCNNNDEIDVGPYMDQTLTDASSTANIWQPALAEPQLFWQTSTQTGSTSICVEYTSGSLCPSGGYYNVGGVGTAVYAGPMYLNANAEANSTHPVPLAVYEENNSSNQGNFSQANLNAYVSAWGQGLANASEWLTNMQNGIATQNVFELTEYYTTPIPNPNANGATYLFDWGNVVSMGGPQDVAGGSAGRRAQFLAQQVVDGAIYQGGSMLTTTQGGTNPTFVVGTSSTSTAVNTVATKSTGVNTIQSFAFTNGSGQYSLVLLNLDIANPQTVSYIGAIVPTGSITQTVLNSTNLSDNNETSAVISPVTTTVGSAPTTLPAHSMYVLSWGGSAAPAVTLSPTSLTFGATNVGTSATTQAITLTNSGSASLTISAISISGDYSQSNTCGTLPASIAASGTCVFTVTFTPTATGTRSGTLTITDNASGSPHTAGLSGTGTATYYVSNSGSDSAAGTIGAPWQTVAKVNATTLPAGATVNFNKGNIWREQLTASTSGTSGNVITYGSYGSGAAPIITGGNLASWTNVSGNVWSTTTSTTGQTCHASATCLQFPNFAGTAGIPVASQAAVTSADDYYFDGTTTLYVYSVGSPASTVEVPTRSYGMDFGGQSYITVSGLQFRGALYYGLNCQSASTGCSNLTLSGNTSTLNTSNGINLFTSTSSRMTVDSLATNTTNYNGSSGIKVGGYWQTFTFSSNTANYNCIVPSSGAYYDNQFCGGIYVYGAGSSADGTYSGTFNATEGSGSTFIGDTAIGNGQAGGTNGNIGNGIWLDTVTTVTVTSELAYGNLNNQIYAEKDIGSFFRHNLGYGAAASNPGTGCLVVAAGQTYNSKNNVFLENTCDGGYSALLTNFETNVGVMVSNLWQNNILYEHTGSGYAYLSYTAINTVSGSTGGTGNSFVTNGFGAARTGIFYYTAAQNTYAAFETAFGASTNSMQQDPALIAPGSGNYGLTSGSPARGAGTAYSGYPAVCGGSHPDLGYLPYACASTITFSPASPAVAEGQTITITASAAVTFTLAGSGTCTGCGTAGQTSVTYTAPSSVTPQHVMLGCQVMPNDSVFNQRIDALPVNSNSSTWVSGSSGLGFSFQPSWGISYADSSTPTRTLKSYYGNYVQTFPWPVWNDMKREGGNYVGSTNFAAPDHHVMTVRRDTCGFYDSYNDKLNGVTVTCQDGVTTGCNLSSAITYPWSNYTVSTTGGGTDAAGLPLAPLTLTLAELKSGSVNHALRFTSAIGYIQGNSNTGSPLLWPASLSNGCSTCTSAPIIGARLRLKSTYNISGFSAYAQTILTAMKQYGMMLADIGTSNAITTGTDITTDAAAVAAIQAIQAANVVMSGNMDFVDESSLEVSATSYQVAPSNGYETPLNSAVLTATPASGSPASVPIALEGVTIGSKIGPNVLVMAGSYTWTIATWVNGSSNQTVNWVLTSGVGSVTTGGVYTPPTTTGGGTAAVLTGTAAADSSATIALYLTILPPGTIRLDTGATSNTTDGASNTWLGGLQPEGWGAQYNDNYPGWQTTNAQKIQYQSGVYSYANDINQNSIIVPNGNYDVSFLLGLNNQCGQIPCGSYPVPGSSSVYTYAPVILESQSEIGYNTYDWLLPIGYVSAAPSPLVTIPAKVTNNVLYAAIRGIANDATPYLAPGTGLTKATYLSGLTIATDGGSPHWTVSTQQQTSIASGQTLNPFLVIDWFTGVNDPTWSVVAPPGISINSSTGVLTAASGTYLAGQPVTVTASDGTYSASATIYTAGGKYLLNAH